MSDRNLLLLVLAGLLLLVFLIFGEDVFAQSQKFATDRDCRQEVSNYISGARFRIHGAPDQFKSVSKDVVHAHIMEHAPLPSDAMYIMDMDVWGADHPEELDLVKDQMLKGWNDGKNYTDQTDWPKVAKTRYDACMSREGT